MIGHVTSEAQRLNAKLSEYGVSLREARARIRATVTVLGRQRHLLPHEQPIRTDLTEAPTHLAGLLNATGSTIRNARWPGRPRQGRGGLLQGLHRGDPLTGSAAACTASSPGGQAAV
ncbi:hypothetical protein BFF78_01075 [Streptomyces fodineus]|uniref:Uncharacterized protein n=1 Tax=Streptomyces fodineus TaxID=1904616 RepID=A0A1D7Y3A0_9ACTN|nr:hypothetical protein [Streptomyces fodineus]AOR29859.1 hypothetical protein BFF78_01075 [Streptomyces fodineus]